ncbi:MAG: hypothetical protein RI897_2613 [Verrucomicrobiota bacterium]
MKEPERSPQRKRRSGLGQNGVRSTRVAESGRLRTRRNRILLLAIIVPAWWPVSAAADMGTPLVWGTMTL